MGLAFLLFGRPGRLSGLMEDLGKGIRGFRKGLGEGDDPAKASEPAAKIVDQRSEDERKGA
jgi:Sec-independent protein translocase protein TatA